MTAEFVLLATAAMGLLAAKLALLMADQASRVPAKPRRLVDLGRLPRRIPSRRDDAGTQGGHC